MNNKKPIINSLDSADYRHTNGYKTLFTKDKQTSSTKNILYMEPPLQKFRIYVKAR
jgi:hypothetical protein